ncbi:hypothetical protein [Maridesulfovibrio sp.]|uniref:hypothetical protein n=1 Tax=Maridesulfovibrio sp. TaxID=2795000 RepID=UPI0029CA8871|nr:hypothetical protein [Maridesulfovibrio sp.]
MKKILGLFSLIILIAARSAFAQETLQVILLVDRPLTADTYIYRVLDLALKNQIIPYSLEIQVVNASEPRRVRIVNSSPKNYIIALGNRKEQEEKLLPIYVPIQLGLGLGQRIMLTRAEVKEKLKKVKNIEDLTQFVFAQGLGWSDVKILRDAGFKVQTPAKPANIPKMIMYKRVDLYPRGLFEIDLEYERYAAEHPGLVIDDNIVLTYPQASFFYVRKNNHKLHDAIKDGMEKAYKSGQLQNLIMTDPVFSKALKEINLGERVRINIPAQNISKKSSEALKKHPFIFNKKKGKTINK